MTLIPDWFSKYNQEVEMSVLATTMFMTFGCAKPRKQIQNDIRHLGLTAIWDIWATTCENFSS